MGENENLGTDIYINFFLLIYVLRNHIWFVTQDCLLMIFLSKLPDKYLIY